MVRLFRFSLRMEKKKKRAYIKKEPILRDKLIHFENQARYSMHFLILMIVVKQKVFYASGTLAQH